MGFWIGGVNDEMELSGLGHYFGHGACWMVCCLTLESGVK